MSQFQRTYESLYNHIALILALMDKNPRQYQRTPSASKEAQPEAGPADVDSAQHEAFLAQLAALAGLPQLPVGDNLSYDLDLLTESLVQQNLPQSSLATVGQPFPSSVQPYMQQFSSGLPWPPSHQGSYANIPTASTSAGPSTSPHGMLSSTELSYAGSAMNSPSISSPSASGEIEMTSDAERTAAEEKRRRNTEASARFRIKKKLKAINLEREVSDLTGRAEELEREVADLRRENGWLKEIVMMKGARFAALNLSQQLEALNPNLSTDGQRSQTSRTSRPDTSAEGEKEDENGNEGTSSGRRKPKNRLAE